VPSKLLGPMIQYALTKLFLEVHINYNSLFRLVVDKLAFYKIIRNFLSESDLIKLAQLFIIYYIQYKDEYRLS
jgi:hypothetical protein